MSYFLDNPAVAEVLTRSRGLGADRSVTNVGGGNTSVKGEIADPLGGERLEVMWVKGSGGDLATLTSDGLAAISLTQLRRLKDVYRGPEDEDRMFDLISLAVLGEGPPPSIDTAMHGLLDVRHVDHVHPDSVIALATAVNGQELTRRCFGDEVAWVPWRRPGFELALMIARLHRDNPQLVGVVLGGHGLTAWGASSDQCEGNTTRLISQAEEFIRLKGKPDPLGAIRPGFGPLPEKERNLRAAALAPAIRGLASTDELVVGYWSDAAEITDFISREATPRVVPLGTSCPDHFIRTKARPLLVDLPSGAPLDDQIRRIRQLHAEYRAEYEDYYERYATADSPPIRAADPAIFLVPGLGMFSFGKDREAAKLACEFYLNAIHVIKGAESLTRYEPIPEQAKFGIEYWELEDRKLRRRSTKPLAGRVALVTGAGSGIGLSIAEILSDEGAAVAIVDIDIDRAEKVAHGFGRPDSVVAVQADVSDEQAVIEAVGTVVRTFGGLDLVVNNAGLSISKSLQDTTIEDWELQYRVMARGSFLVSKHSAQVMIDQGRGGDIVYIASKNAVVAGSDNVAYGSAKASQAHQIRLLAAELGVHGIRVNGINPDGVVQGSGIFAGAWGADRARVYGVPVEDLGKHYASRTLLGREVLPRHVAEAVLTLVGGGLSRTTGMTIPVDSGLPSAFLR